VSQVGSPNIRLFASLSDAARADGKPVRKAPSRELPDVIDRITPDNMHESMFDDLVGGERW
jgi:hypothetical protein